MRNVSIVFFVLVLMIFSFFMGYGVGMSDPEPKEIRELEKQLKVEELKKLRLNNEGNGQLVKIGDKYYGLKVLFDSFEFLDGSPCGVEK